MISTEMPSSMELVIKVLEVHKIGSNSVMWMNIYYTDQVFVLYG